MTEQTQRRSVVKKGLLLAVAAVLLAVVACDSDTEKPTVTIVFPADGANLGTGTITIKAVALDNKAVIKVEFYDGADKIGEDGTGTADTFDISWTAAAGTHTIKAVAWDGANNRADHSITVNVTPGGGGTGPTYHDGDISADETWYPSGNPHIVRADIGVGNAKLTILPGCVVKFDAGRNIGFGWSPNFPATLIAVGKPDSVIVFTSNLAVPAPGDWGGIRFFEGTRPESKMSYCKISYAGESDGEALYFSDCHIAQFDHSSIRHSAGYGININYFGYALDMSYDTIEQCGRYPIQIMPEHVGLLGAGNKFSPNAKEGILLPHGGVEQASATWRNHGTPYVIATDVWVGPLGGPEVTLTIAPGVTVKFAPEAYLNVGTNGGLGALIADSVTFTSVSDAPVPGDWAYIAFGDGTRPTSRIHNSTIEYGGKFDWGNIFISNSKPDIRGCNIGHSSAWGIYLEGELQFLPDPDSLEANNNFYDNAHGKVSRP